MWCRAGKSRRCPLLIIGGLSSAEALVSVERGAHCRSHAGSRRPEALIRQHFGFIILDNGGSRLSIALVGCHSAVVVAHDYVVVGFSDETIIPQRPRLRTVERSWQTLWCPLRQRDLGARFFWDAECCGTAANPPDQSSSCRGRPSLADASVCEGFRRCRRKTGGRRTWAAERVVQRRRSHGSFLRAGW